MQVSVGAGSADCSGGISADRRKAGQTAATGIEHQGASGIPSRPAERRARRLGGPGSYILPLAHRRYKEKLGQGMGRVRRRTGSGAGAQGRRAVEPPGGGVYQDGLSEVSLRQMRKSAVAQCAEVIARGLSVNAPETRRASSSTSTSQTGGEFMTIPPQARSRGGMVFLDSIWTYDKKTTFPPSATHNHICFVRRLADGR
jgi:hypothetical protein